MKRPSDEDDGRNSSSESQAEDFASRFLQKHPQFFIYLGIGIGVLIVVALLISNFSSMSH